MYFSRMAKAESLEEFYRHKFNQVPTGVLQDAEHFNVFSLEEALSCMTVPAQYTRRDFYKVTLMRGKNICHYANKSIEVEGSNLMFFSSHVPYTWESVSGDYTGYFCVFKEAFFTAQLRSNIRDLPMFQIGSKPSYALTQAQDKQVSQIFQKMLDEVDSDYPFKHDLLRNYVTELIHFALKMKPSEKLYQHPDAKARITAVFMELLEQQFPIESPHQRFSLRSARDFADKLAVHVNYLNRSVKGTTGKTTTDHIADRLTSEAIALLKHTRWNISEISYSLGFEEPAHFSHFLKKQTQQTPSSFRVH